MKTLNFVYPALSEIEYEKVKYPDGQVSIKFTDTLEEDLWKGRGLLADLPNKVLIKSRMNSYEDLIFIISANQVLRKYTKVSLFCPYIFTSRSDRAFNINQSFDSKIVTNILNSCEFEKITIYDPHSDVLPALLNTNVEIKTTYDWIVEGVTNTSLHPLNQMRHTIKEVVLISPDAGAYKKIFSLGQKLNLPIISANKHRNSQGNITLNIEGDVTDKVCCIVDDICDGGATFDILGQKLKEKGAYEVNLFVTHGIFSKGVISNIDFIWTTNSIADKNDSTPAQLCYRINLFK